MEYKQTDVGLLPPNTN